MRDRGGGVADRSRRPAAGSCRPVLVVFCPLDGSVSGTERVFAFWDKRGRGRVGWGGTGGEGGIRI